MAAHARPGFDPAGGFRLHGRAGPVSLETFPELPPRTPASPMKHPARPLPFPIALLAILLATTPVSAQAGADHDEVRAQAHTCIACHGEYGQKEAPGQPRIGGRDYYELLAAMASYRTVQRFHPAMTTLMLSLDEAGMSAAAEYFAGIDPARVARKGPYND